MRNGPGKFIMIPNNTLAKGDIIRLLPGDTAPALCELIPYDIEID
jgi:magnesium-transporting ATPase (P-type)